MIRHKFVAALLVAAFLLPACGSSSPVDSSTTTPTPTPAPATTETFTGTIAAPTAGAPFNVDVHTFVVTTANNLVDLTLTQVTIAGVPSTIHMQLGLGQPSGGSCVIITGGAFNGPAGASGTTGIAEVSGTLNASGTFCVQVADIGNIPVGATANYTVTVLHS